MGTRIYVAVVILIASSAFVSQAAERPGSISGTVVNASRSRAPAGGSTVVLRVRQGGDTFKCRETTADDQGKFTFTDLPVGPEYTYIPGANRDEIHHPGTPVLLTSSRPRATVEIAVYDTVASPSPLMIESQDVLIRTEPGAVYVTESLSINNPSSVCFVGQAPKEGLEPITLELAIPSDFERATFEKEFFGRRFSVLNGKLATGIPWPPGRREIKLTYVLPNRQSYRVWERPIDLPCSHVRVRIQTPERDKVACNLDRADGAADEVVFESAGRELTAGETIRVELGKLPVPVMAYARLAAVGTLVMLIAGTFVMLARRRGAPRTASASLPAPSRIDPVHPTRDRKRRDRAARRGRGAKR